MRNLSQSMFGKIFFELIFCVSRFCAAIIILVQIVVTAVAIYGISILEAAYSASELYLVRLLGWYATNRHSTFYSLRFWILGTARNKLSGNFDSKYCNVTFRKDCLASDCVRDCVCDCIFPKGLSSFCCGWNGTKWTAARS